MSPIAPNDDAENSQHHDLLEWVVIRLLAMADRCGDPAIRYELMQVVDRLVELIEDENAITPSSRRFR